MLDKFLKTAIEMNADTAEFEYEGNGLYVTAFRGRPAPTTGEPVASRARSPVHLRRQRDRHHDRELPVVRRDRRLRTVTQARTGRSRSSRGRFQSRPLASPCLSPHVPFLSEQGDVPR